MNAYLERFAVRGELLQNESMARHTSWRVGGPADWFFTPADLEDLQQFIRELPNDTPLYWIGLGSNLLVRDGGVRGAVIATHGVLDDLQRQNGRRVRAGAGVACAKLARQAVKWNLAGADFFAGIPGTVGGALAMNAGAFGSETWPWVVEVEVLNRNGDILQRLPNEYAIGYRSVKGPADEWFVAATFAFEATENLDRSGIKSLLKKRGDTQPIGLPSCGSVFRNPEGDHAARLIESCGLKGFRIGGAEVSTKHANFIINTGDASAQQIEELILHVQSTVNKATGIQLIPEVRIIGAAA